MNEKRRNEILLKLHDGTLKTNAEKVEYLDSVIEPIDYDNNGINDELIELRNKLNHKAPL